MTAAEDESFGAWLAALEARHLADLRVPEVTRALRALSSAYVERRRTTTAQPARGALDSAGKRAAFALFYGPLHFITVTHVVQALGAPASPPAAILDLGCGTGVAGAAWAIAGGRRARVLGLDRHPWALAEARWTYRTLGITGRTRMADVTAFPTVGEGSAVIAGWTLNELAGPAREHVERKLFECARRGARVLVLEPVAHAVAPWWESAAARVREAGGRADVWRFDAGLPPLVRTLDKAAGLDHRELTVRTLFL